MITIQPYSPALNSAEKLILSIKHKINKEVYSGKYRRFCFNLNIIDY